MAPQPSRWRFLQSLVTVGGADGELACGGSGIAGAEGRDFDSRWHPVRARPRSGARAAAGTFIIL